MGLRDWFTHDDDGSDSGQWWQTGSFTGHPDEGLFRYRLSSAPDDGALYGTWHQVADGGSAAAWGPFPPHGGQVFDGPSDATRWGDWGRGMGGRRLSVALWFEGHDTDGEFVQGEVDVDDVNAWVREQYASGYWRYLKVWEFPTGAWVARIDVDEDGPYWLVDDRYGGGEATS